MRTLHVNFWTKEEDGKHLMYCTDPKIGTDFTVVIPNRFSDIINFKQLKNGLMTLPADYSIKIAS